MKNNIKGGGKFPYCPLRYTTDYGTFQIDKDKDSKNELLSIKPFEGYTARKMAT